MRIKVKHISDLGECFGIEGCSNFLRLYYFDEETFNVLSVPQYKKYL